MVATLKLVIHYSKFTISNFLVLLTILAVLMGCQDGGGDGADIRFVETVVVTRATEVEVTRFATVAVPVEVTREVLVEVTAGSQLEDADLVAQPAVSTEAKAEIGSAESPLTLVLAPTHPLPVLELRGNALVNAMSDLSGLEIELFIASTHEEAVLTACENPDSTLAVLPEMSYVLAEEMCDLQIRFAGVRNGYPYRAGMVLVPRGSDVNTLEELDGLSWGVGSLNDSASGLYFTALFNQQGIEAFSTELGDPTTTVVSVWEGTQGFATAEFIPPILPYDERLWEYGEDDPELWVRTGYYPIRSGIGFAVVYDYVENGGYQVRDARSNAFDVYNDIFFDTEIMMLSEPIPNGAIAFSPLIPLRVAESVASALETHVKSEGCVSSVCSPDHFMWEGVELVDDSFYDSIRFIFEYVPMNSTEVYDHLSR